MNEKICVIHCDSELEKAFYHKLQQLSQGMLISKPMNRITDAAVCISLRNISPEASVFISIDGRNRYGFIDSTDVDFHRLADRCHRKISKIGLRPTLLHCLAQHDEADFRHHFPSDRQLSVMCHEIYDSGLNREKSLDIIQCIDLQQVIVNCPAFSELACLLGLTSS